MSDPGTAAPRVVIVGGGFTGASAAVQAVRRSTGPIDITLLDPAEAPGRGLAYRTTDPDHRLNAPVFVHSMLPDDAGHFARWCADQRIAADDPQALLADGSLYARRADFGRYLCQTLQAHRQGWPSGATITHVRDLATGLVPAATGAGWAVHRASGDSLRADLVLVATGNSPQRWPDALGARLAGHPAMVDDPFDTAALQRIAASARVLVVGSGLTALDVLATLVRRGHQGPIQVVSRHGLRPQVQGPLPAALSQALRGDLAALPPGMVLARLQGPPPAWLAAPAVPPTVRAWLRALRRQARLTQAAGGTWYTAFDDLRDAVWQLWPQLPALQKQRFVRQLRPWYDVHRYRSPPQSQALVDAAVQQGQIQFLAARLRSLAPAVAGAGVEACWMARGRGAVDTQHFDAVIHCAGLDAQAGLARNPLLSALARAGWVRPDPSGMGIEVDALCRAVGANGQVHPGLRVLGPPTVGSAGDAIGALFIAAQIHRMLPDALSALGR